MQSALGISISDKMIKYAKVQNDSNKFKVVASGVKFYESLKLDSTINQIVQETDSTKIPISINLRNEKYYYFDIFKLSNDEYINKAAQTEFESFCVDNHLNKDSYIGRIHTTRSLENPDKSRVMYVYDNKNSFNETRDLVSKYNLQVVIPEAVALPNLIKIEKNKKIVIVDLNEKTTVTTVIAGNLYDIKTLEHGMEPAFDAINSRENSYSKAYEVCKNTTIYTMETVEQGQTTEGNEYLQYIVPELYKIVQELKKYIENYQNIDQIYLTGQASVINNIDLYFQEFFHDSHVEILKPFFAENDSKINIKDYIEANSAIALAIQGLGFGIKTLNFKSNDLMKKIKSFLFSDISSIRENSNSSGENPIKEIFKNIKLPNISSLTSNEKLGPNDAKLITSMIIIILVIIMFCVSSMFVANQITKKMQEAEQTISYTKQQKSLADSDDSKINSKTQDYIRYKSNLEDTSAAIEEKRSRKNQITNLLSKIAYTIPKGVTLTEIKNTENTSGNSTTESITITARAAKYEQLAYFKAKLKNAGILENVVSTEGEKSGDNVTVVIKGDLATY